MALGQKNYKIRLLEEKYEKLLLSYKGGDIKTQLSTQLKNLTEKTTPRTELKSP